MTENGPRTNAAQTNSRVAPQSLQKYLALNDQLWEMYQKSAEHELALMDEVRRLRVIILESDAAVQQNLRLQKDVEDLRKIAAESEQRVAEEATRIREECELEKLEYNKELTEGLAAAHAERDAIAAEMRELITHLGTVDQYRAVDDANREDQLKENKTKIQRLEKANRELSQHLKEARDAQTSLYKQLELSRERITLLDENNHRLQVELSGAETLRKLEELVALLSASALLGASPTPSMSLTTEIQPLQEIEQIELIRSSDLFDEAWYMARYGDRLAADESPVEHYVRSGYRIGLWPSPQFDGPKYVAKNPDVAALGQNPLYHYLKYGRDEGRRIPDFTDDRTILTTPLIFQTAPKTFVSSG